MKFNMKTLVTALAISLIAGGVMAEMPGEEQMKQAASDPALLKALIADKSAEEAVLIVEKVLQYAMELGDPATVGDMLAQLAAAAISANVDPVGVAEKIIATVGETYADKVLAAISIAADMLPNAQEVKEAAASAMPATSDPLTIQDIVTDPVSVVGQNLANLIVRAATGDETAIYREATDYPM